MIAYNNLNNASVIYKIKFKNEYVEPHIDVQKYLMEPKWIILAAIFILLFISVLIYVVYYKKKIRKLKEEID